MGSRISLEDLLGQRYGKLVLIKEVDPHISLSGMKKRRFLCQCDCGKLQTILLDHLRRGTTTSCGCYGSEVLKAIQQAKRIPLTELIGKRFGRLVLLEEVEPSVYLNSRIGGSKKRRILCQCDCGKTVIVGINALKNGSTKSCGCFQQQQSSETHKKHGQRNSVLYSRWIGMKKRCYNKNFLHYKDYGGRGIRICDEWLNNFQAFYDWAMANGFKEELQIDREHNNGNYTPDNCRFITQIENLKNRRKYNKG